MCKFPTIINGHIVPCGSCISCKKKRQNGWVTRMILENKINKGNSCFITLTYNDDNLPKNEILIKKDLQDFLKRLRINLQRHYDINQIRYFACGEYGNKKTNNLRPHFHLIIYGINKEYENEINNSWGKGFIYVTPTNYANFRYVAKYCIKEFAKEKKIKKINETTGEVEFSYFKEFVTMSRRYGLGFSILKDTNEYLKYMIDGVKVGKYTYSLPYSITYKAKKLGMPSFIKDYTLIYNERIFKTLEDFKKSTPYFIFKDNLFKNDEYYDDDVVDGFKCITLKEYFNSLELETRKEKEYCFKTNYNYNTFYLKRFNFLKKNLFYNNDNSNKNLVKDYYLSSHFLKNDFTVESKFKILKEMIYNNFNYIYY